LYKVVRQFAEIDLPPDEVPNEEMGYIYEEPHPEIQRAEQRDGRGALHAAGSDRTDGQSRLQEDDEALTEQDAIRTVYDPACGTGGMLSVAEEYVRQLNTDANLHVFGQELNPESYAVCNSDMLIKGQEPENIIYGNSFTEDGFPSRTFDYMLRIRRSGSRGRRSKTRLCANTKRKGCWPLRAGTPPNQRRRVPVFSSIC